MHSFPNFEPVSCCMSTSNCCFLTCIQVSQETGKVVWYSHLFKNFPVCCVPHRQRLSLVSKAEVEVYFEFPCFLYDPVHVGNLISGSSAFSKPSLYIGKFLVHILLKLRWRILCITWLACEMSTIVGSLNILWHCPSLGLEWKLTFSSPVASAEFSTYADISSAAL